MRKVVPAAIIRKHLDSLKSDKPLQLIELGAICREGADGILFDGYSTVYIARFAVEKGAKFKSLDLNIEIANGILKRYALRDAVELLQSDSKELSSIEGNFDFAYFDHDADAETLLRDFKAIEPRMNPGGIILVNNIDWTASYNGRTELLMPYLDEKGMRREPDDTMLVVRKR